MREIKSYIYGKPSSPEKPCAEAPTLRCHAACTTVQACNSQGLPAHSSPVLAKGASGHDQRCARQEVLHGNTLAGTKKRPSVGILYNFSDFLGRLQPSKTTIQKTRGTLGVEESSYPRKVPHFYSSNSFVQYLFIVFDSSGNFEPS